MSIQTQKKFNGRQLASLIVTFAFIIIAVSGLVLYIVPPGRVANWTNWMLFGLTKDQWAAVHTIFAFIFIVSGIFHIYFNWRILIGYLKYKTQSGFRNQLELTLSSLFTLAVLLLTITDLPPSQQIMAWGENIKESWDIGDIQAPFPHAEEFSLESLAVEINLALELAVKRLQDNGFRGVTPAITVLDLASLNNTSPEKIFSALKNLKVPPSPEADAQSTGQPSPADRLPVSGLGRLTLSETATRLEIPLALAISTLNQHHINVDSSDKLKDIADEIGLTPVEVVELIQASQDRK